MNETYMMYIEFTHNLIYLENVIDAMGSVTFDEEFTEAAVAPSKVTIRQAVANTWDTTKDAGRVYGDITDAGGNLAGSIWKLVVSAAKLVTKVLSFIMNHISKLPKMLSKGIDGLSKLPSDVRAKVRGDISIYVTAEDLKLFRDTINPEIVSFIALATELTTGDFVQTLTEKFKKRPFDGNANNNPWFVRIGKPYLKLKGIEFEKTYIPLGSGNNAANYLNPNSEYFKTLTDVILKDLKAHVPKLTKLQGLMGTQLDSSRVKGEYAKLSTKEQIKVKETINMISTVIKVVGNFIKFITADIATITGASVKIANSVAKDSKKEDKTVKKIQNKLGNVEGNKK